MAMSTDKYAYVTQLPVTDLRQFLTAGIPQVRFQRVRSESSKHTSDHSPVVREDKNSPLNTFTDNVDLWMDRKYLSLPSLILVALIPLKNQIMISSESDIRILVWEMIRDAIAIAGLSGEVSLLGECSVTVERTSRKTNRGDYYVVARNDGRPVLVLEVKSPPPLPSARSVVPNRSLLDEPRVVGQMTDYMLDLATFFGQEDVFGISTTFDEWKFHWFEHSADVAAASTTAALAALRPTGELPAERPPLQRQVCSSRIFPHTDKALPEMLVSVLQKSYRSRTLPTRVLDAQRLYLSLTANAWMWRRMPQAELALHGNLMTLLPRPSTKACTTFTVLRYFQKGPDHRVWLCVAGQNPGCLVVAKQCLTHAAAQQEQDCWHRVNGCDTWIKVINGEPAICMPLVILARQDSNTGVVAFDFNLRNLCGHTDPDPASFPAPLAQLAEDIATAGVNHTNARVVAEVAIARCAAQRIEHQDLHWRHVGLLPVLGEDNRLRELRPVLVDFGRCVEAATVEEARASMQGQLLG